MDKTNMYMVAVMQGEGKFRSEAALLDSEFKPKRRAHKGVVSGLFRRAMERVVEAADAMDSHITRMAHV